MQANYNDHMKECNENETFGLVIADLSRLLRKLFDSKIKDIVPVSLAQWHVLVRLWQKDGLSQSELAERVEIEQSSLVRHLDNLETQGFITRKPDENDRRSNRVYLTEASKPLFDKVFSVVIPLREDLVSDLSKTEFDQMMTSLRKIKCKTACLIENLDNGTEHA